MKRAIHLFPKFENMFMIQEYREKYDPLFKAIPPHITLCFPFSSHISKEDLKLHLEHVLCGASPFAIRLSGITSHLNEYLFLNVINGNDRMIDLHRRVYQGILADFLDRRYTYFPHLTIGRTNNADKLLDEVERSAIMSAVFETWISEIVVETIEQDGMSNIEFVHQLSL